MTNLNLDHKKFLESILQGGDEDDEIGLTGDADVDQILNEVDEDYHAPQKNQSPSDNKENLGHQPAVQISKPETIKKEESKHEEKKDYLLDQVKN